MNSAYLIGVNLALKVAGFAELGTAALNIAKAHPLAAASAGMGAVGAAGGALTADKGHRMGGALGGAALGAGLPLAAEGVHSLMNGAPGMGALSEHISNAWTGK
jgi:hypothetical protein